MGQEVLVPGGEEAGGKEGGPQGSGAACPQAQPCHRPVLRLPSLASGFSHQRGAFVPVPLL